MIKCVCMKPWKSPTLCSQFAEVEDATWKPRDKVNSRAFRVAFVHDYILHNYIYMLYIYDNVVQNVHTHLLAYSNIPLYTIPTYSNIPVQLSIKLSRGPTMTQALRQGQTLRWINDQQRSQQILGVWAQFRSTGAWPWRQEFTRRHGFPGGSHVVPRKPMDFIIGQGPATPFGQKNTQLLGVHTRHPNGSVEPLEGEIVDILLQPISQVIPVLEGKETYQP